MKLKIHFFTAVILIAAISLSSAQDKSDSIKVYFEAAKIDKHPENIEYYIDSALVKNVDLEMFKANDIAKIDVVKGEINKIYITIKSDVRYSLVSLQFLGDKYLKGKKSDDILYTVDGKLIINPETLINEKDVLSVSVAADQIISSLRSGKVTVFKVLTRSKLNIDKSNAIYIRGNVVSLDTSILKNSNKIITIGESATKNPEVMGDQVRIENSNADPFVLRPYRDSLAVKPIDMPNAYISSADQSIAIPTYNNTPNDTAIARVEQLVKPKKSRKKVK